MLSLIQGVLHQYGFFQYGFLITQQQVFITQGLLRLKSTGSKSRFDFLNNKKILTEGLQLDGPKLNQPKWNFSTFCGLYGTTSYPQLPLRRIDPPDTRSHPQGGVQIYPKVKFTRQNHEKKVMLPPHQFLLNSHIR